MTAAIREISSLNIPIVPVNDHPLRQDHVFGNCIHLAEILGAMMTEINPEDHSRVWQALIDAHKEKCEEIFNRSKGKADEIRNI